MDLDEKELEATKKGMIKNMLSREKAEELAKIIDNNLPTDMGFCLLVFPFNKQGKMQYISNGNRQDVANAMLEWLCKVNNDGKFGKDI